MHLLGWKCIQAKLEASVVVADMNLKGRTLHYKLHIYADRIQKNSVVFMVITRYLLFFVFSSSFYRFGLSIVFTEVVLLWFKRFLIITRDSLSDIAKSFCLSLL